MKLLETLKSIVVGGEAMLSFLILAAVVFIAYELYTINLNIMEIERFLDADEEAKHDADN